MEFAGDRLGKLLWNTEELPGMDLHEEMASMSGRRMSQRIRELMRLRSDKHLPRDFDSAMLRDWHDGLVVGMGDYELGQQDE